MINKNFLEVRLYDNSECLININTITTLMRDTKNPKKITIIYFSGEDSIKIDESYESIKNRLSNDKENILNNNK